MDQIVNVPVPVGRLTEVYSLLGRPPGNEVAPTPDIKPGADAVNGWSAALIERAVRESDLAIRRFFALVADHADAWVSIDALNDELKLPKGLHSIAGMLGAFGVRTKNRYKKDTWFFDYERREYRPWYRMSGDAAQIVRRALASHPIAK